MHIENTIYDPKLLNKKEDVALQYSRGSWYLTKGGGRFQTDDLLLAIREAVELVELLYGTACVRILESGVFNTPFWRLSPDDHDLGAEQYATREALSITMQTKEGFCIMIHPEQNYEANVCLDWERASNRLDVDVSPPRLARLFYLGYFPKGLHRAGYAPVSDRTISGA